MDNDEPMPVEAVWAAMRNLANELDATHAPPFTTCFFEEHQDAIERVFRLLAGCNPEDREGP